MYCSHCGTQLSEGASLCRYCGWDNGEKPAAEKAPAAKAPKRKLFFLLGGIVLCAVIAAAAVMVSGHNARQLRYNEGVAYLENGEYGKALQTFSALGPFDDSAEMAAYAQQGILYEKAAELFAAGSYAESEALFLSAGAFQDAPARAEECEAFRDYDAARERMENGEYEEAKELLAPLDPALFPDKDELTAECDCMPDYLEAVSQLEDGRYYAAYTIFTRLGSFRDAASLAESCIVSEPDTGELYRNSGYGGYDCALTVQPPADDGSRTYIKIYSSDGTLVSCLFIRAGDAFTVSLPAGEYVLKSAYGYGAWFGEEGMFGDDGTYQVLKPSPATEIITLEPDYEYTLMLRTAGSDGDAVSTEAENREDF